MFSVWNEPNLGQFLTPQYEGTKIVSPAITRSSSWPPTQGSRPAIPNAVVAAGETSNRGRDKPSGEPGQDYGRAGHVRAAARAGRTQAARSSAWATHPYPSDFKFGPDAEGRVPERRLLDDDDRSGESLQKWFERRCRSGSPSTAR